MRVAILVEALLNRGGADRVVLIQTLHYDADIYTAAYDGERTYPEFKQLRIHTIVKGNIRGINHLRVRRAFAKLRLSDYDVVIAHNSSCLEAAPHHHPFIWYCHAPSRWSHDLYQDELRKKHALLRVPFAIICQLLRKRDARNITHVDAIATNSHNVKQRLQRYYPVHPIVIYPPIDTSRFKWLGQSDFYLSTARLDPIKRVDLVVESFKHLPDRNVVIVGTGPDEQRLRTLARGHSNIRFTGSVTNEQLARLYGTCLALLTPSYKEDFGMVPLEANSAGKPVIATKDGGYLETVIPGKTGILLEEPLTPDAIIDAITTLTPARARTMRIACEQNAKRYSIERFNKEMDEFIDRVLAPSRPALAPMQKRGPSSVPTSPHPPPLSPSARPRTSTSTMRCRTYQAGSRQGRTRNLRDSPKRTS